MATPPAKKKKKKKKKIILKFCYISEKRAYHAQTVWARFR